MASSLIRDVNSALHARLKARAARNRCSLEEEVRELLRAAVARSDEDEIGQVIVGSARRLFGRTRGVSLNLPARERSLAGPDFSGPEYSS